MPPILALILCLAFVLFLLRLENKQSPDVTKALWIPTIWILYVASKPLGAWFQVSLQNPEAGSPLDRAFLTTLTLIALWILVRRGFDWLGAIKENPWLMILIVFMLVSIFWSNIPAISFKRWVRELQAVLMAFMVLSEPFPRQAMESIFRRTAYILIPFSPVLIKYFPQYGVEYNRWTGARMWMGVTLQKNGLGRLCIIVAFFLIWSLIRRWQGNNPPVRKYQTYVELLILAMVFWLMRGQGGGSYSATSIISLFVAILVYWILYFFRKNGKYLRASTLMIIVTVIILFGVVTVYTGEIRFGSLTTAIGRNETLTDRTAIWASLLPNVKQKPLLGSGFGGFWTPSSMAAYRINSAHGGYLDMLLVLGFCGIVLVSIYLMSSCQKAQRALSRDFDWGALWLGYIIMFVVHNITESSINSFAMHMSAVILFFTVASIKSLAAKN